MQSKTKVLVYGLGYIGRMVVEALQNENPFWNRKLELLAAIDVVPESRQWAKKKNIAAYQNLTEFLAQSERPDVCIQTTASTLSFVKAQLKELIEAKIPVVSSTEELFFPWQTHAKLAAEVDSWCKTNQVAVLGTGVNPGFVMDVLPALCSQVVHTVDSLKVERVVDASTRRLPLQKKIGAGLDEPTFRALAEKQKIGHVGLLESLDFLASHIGVQLSERIHIVDPVLAKQSFKTALSTIKRGEVCGIQQRAIGKLDRKTIIELDLKIVLNAEHPGDWITLTGNPTVKFHIEDGTPGDSATVAALVRGIPIVLQAKPGIVRRLERDHFLN